VKNTAKMLQNVVENTFKAYEKAKKKQDRIKKVLDNQMEEKR